MLSSLYACGEPMPHHRCLRDMQMCANIAIPNKRQLMAHLIPDPAQSHKDLVDGVVALAKRVQADASLAAMIRRKFAIKCTTGYSLNALVDFPVRIPEARKAAPSFLLLS